MRIVLKRFLQFCLYLTLVNFILWVVRIGEINKGLPWFVVSAFYYYNLAVMALAAILYTRYRMDFLRVTIFSLIGVAILQVLLHFIFGTSDDLRGAMFFNNPNQLGYYALSALGAVLIIEDELKLPVHHILIAFFFYAIMFLESISKAALGSLVILLLIYLFNNGLLNQKTLLRTFLIGVIGTVIFVFTDFGRVAFESLMVRNAERAEIRDEVSEWEYRGYDRMTNHPEYMILGAGEGAYNRFDTYIEDHEIHSSLGTILFCYGIPGSILFLIFVFSLFKGLSYKRILFSLPLFAYGVTHMGLRFTIFWIAIFFLPITQVHTNYSIKIKILLSWLLGQKKDTLQKEVASID